MAAKLKAEGGTGSFGAIEVKTFQLPNPGGGADLLEDASCVLVPGHRCVLHALRPLMLDVRRLPSNPTGDTASVEGHMAVTGAARANDGTDMD